MDYLINNSNLVFFKVLLPYSYTDIIIKNGNKKSYFNYEGTSCPGTIKLFLNTFKDFKTKNLLFTKNILRTSGSVNAFKNHSN